MSTTIRAHATRAAGVLALIGTLSATGAGVASADPLTEVVPIATVSMPEEQPNADGMSVNGEFSVMSSRRITVTNMSGDSMKLASVGGDKWFEGRPADGSVIPPGGSHAWEMTYKYARTNADTVVYKLTGPDGRTDGWVTLDLRVESIGIWSPSISSACLELSSQSGIQCRAGGDTVTIADAA